ncbi:MAG: asparagine synthase-related protein [Chloroflexota bacterium]|nr:asparagine synthase-related protein [Chloroflexota bacterium]
MSGFAVGYGNHDSNKIEIMMNMITHRGSYTSGVYRSGQVIMAQNYLRADGAVIGGDTIIPVRSLNNPNLMICYDGQMGDWQALASQYNVTDGPFREERLILELYEKHGKDMLKFLGDTIFALVIYDGDDIFAARDLLGIKTLFYAIRDNAIYLTSELKSITKVGEAICEFPNGHYMTGDGLLIQFAELPKNPPQETSASIEEISQTVRDIIERSFNNRIYFDVPTGGLLSGGMDSSVINYIGSKEYKKKYGADAKLKTFALGVGESNDIHSARTMAKHIDSEHHEVIIDLQQLLDVLPEVIYNLEHFDPSLVRSSASNYLISKYAKENGMEILLSGEGGDEVFCGYKYLGEVPTEDLFVKQMECISFLHNNASLRLDRMNQCNSIRVVAPLISGELLNYSLTIPPEYKQYPNGEQKIEKWIFRKAYEGLLPDEIVWRSKQEFSQGSGSADVLPSYFSEQISDAELAEAQAEHPIIRSKEELHYFRLFTKYFGDGDAVKTVGQWLLL